MSNFPTLAISYRISLPRKTIFPPKNVPKITPSDGKLLENWQTYVANYRVGPITGTVIRGGKYSTQLPLI